MYKKHLLVPGLVIFLLLSSCGPSIEDAQKLGFRDIEEMKASKNAGIKNGEDLARSRDFKSLAEMRDAEKAGFPTASAYALSKGFSSLSEMRDIESKGFTDFLSYVKSKNFPSVKEFRAAQQVGRTKSYEDYQSYLEEKRKEDAKEAYESACRKNYRDCKDNTDVVDVNSSVPISGKVACKVAAEKAAAWQVDWGSWYEPNFTSYLKGSSAKTDGTITLIDNVAKYQNGFGAWRKAKTVCDYNIDKDIAVIIAID